MKINNIILYNFGSYEGETAFDTRTNEAGKNIVLVGGKNGAGKTTLFTAMRVCLYGYMSMGYKNANAYYHRAIIKLINNSAKMSRPAHAHVEMQIALSNGRDIELYTLKRGWILAETLTEYFGVRSYHFARQVLDLSQYYREASNHDVECFVKNSIVQMENNETFVGEANSWERRKIAAIIDAGTLTRFTAIEIKNRAKKSGVKLTVSGGKIMLPADRAERKLVLAFLDEEVYKGPFTDQVFQTNSKRIAQ